MLPVQAIRSVGQNCRIGTVTTGSTTGIKDLAIGLEGALLLVGTPGASEKEQAEEITQMTTNVENNENTNRPKSGLVGKILIGGALATALGG